MKPIVKVVIPAYNEEQSIGHVIKEIPKEWVSEIIVVNNGSKDKTADVAIAHGATVLNQPKPGYGNACLTTSRTQQLRLIFWSLWMAIIPTIPNNYLK